MIMASSRGRDARWGIARSWRRPRPAVTGGHEGCLPSWLPACASRKIKGGTSPARAGRTARCSVANSGHSMYLDPFKLKELPFRLSPDPQFLYLSKQHARAKAYMESTIWFSDGYAVTTGEIGAGKTTLIESFLKEIQSDVVVAQINQTQVSAVDFLQAILVQFG